ncbi:UNVERIFIED_CONTAM: hypothetical protein GTU68_029929 [Idotea baltica]|nr:hypothetical protein [Idotea baltica]
MIATESFNKKIDGKDVSLYTLKNKHGMVVQITNYGGKIVSIIVTDRHGDFDDVVTGYDNIDEYISGDNSFGALIGRYGNRIANAQFELDGKTYKLAKNNGENHLHGGLENFSKKVWEMMSDNSDDQKLTLHYLSKDGEEGFPGNLDVRVVYSLTDKNELIIDYYATTDKTTIVNLTNHAYFNLAGNDFPPIYDHELQIIAEQYVATKPDLIPLGEFWNVADTPMDFRSFSPIGKHINDDYEPLKYGGGYDQSYVLKNDDGKLVEYATVKDPKSGRMMICSTTEPGVQLYTANHFSGKPGKGGVKYNKHTAFCLETQHYPNSPNQPNFPSATLTPDDMYKTTTIYKFSTF